MIINNRKEKSYNKSQMQLHRIKHSSSIKKRVFHERIKLVGARDYSTVFNHKKKSDILSHLSLASTLK